MTSTSVASDDLPLAPLKITCTSTDCENGLHCFLQTRKMQASNQRGLCRSCGADLIDWKRVHARDLGQVAYVFNSLRLEMFRHHYWHIQLDQVAVDKARKKGGEKVSEELRKRLISSVGPANPPFDGRQTPLKGNVIYYAQHAIGACCRKCINEWHGIPMGDELTPAEIDYLAALAQLYLDHRIPEIFAE